MSAKPTILAVFPEKGPTSGGQDVVINGTHFAGVSGASAVRFGDKEAKVYRVLSSNQIMATTPPHAAGSVDITVVAPGGTATRPDAFAYTDLTQEEAEKILVNIVNGTELEGDVPAAPTVPTGELYQTLLEQMPAVTFMTSFDPVQRVYVSPQIQDILGYSPEEWLARPSLWYECLHPDEKERWNREFAETVVARGKSVRKVYRFIHRDGRVVWILGDVQIRRDEKSGFPLFVQAVGFDVTELEEAREQLRQAKDREIADEKKRVARLQSQVKREFGPDQLVGTSERMDRLRGLIRKVARSEASVLITGESGTGKELVARALHYSGRRKDKAFVALNCGAFPESTLLDSALFGHEKGAFTGATERRIGRLEEADGGTLFLDEIGNMPELVQDKILRFIQERTLRRLGSNRDMTVDVRIIAATHRDLPGLISDGKFKVDLYYKLKVVSIEVPSLRDRAQDIQELAEHFLARANRAEKRDVRLSEEAMRILKNHSWSENNVRELEHSIEAAVVVAEGETILPEDLPPAVTGARPQPPSETEGRRFYDEVETLERSLIVQALRRSKGVRAEAARNLSLNVGTLTNKMTYYGIEALKEAPWVKEA